MNETPDTLIEKLNPQKLARLMKLYENSGYSIKFTDWLVAKINNDSYLLHWLVSQANEEKNNYSTIACKLIDEGAKLEGKGTYLKQENSNLLHIAVLEKNCSVIKKILEKDIKQLYEKNANEETPHDLATQFQGDDEDFYEFMQTEIENKSKPRESEKRYKLTKADYTSLSATAKTGDNYSGYGQSSSSSYSNSYRSQTPIGSPLNDTPTWQNVACSPDDSWLFNATCQIQWKNLEDNEDIEQNVSQKNWGSGFMITDKLMMTAGHCFDSQNDKDGWYVLDKEEDTPLKPRELPPLMKVNFNYQASECDITPYMTFSSQPSTSYNAQECNIVRLVEHRKNDLDYAIVELDRPVSHNQQVALCADLPAINDEVVVAQHPAGLDKKVAHGKVCSITGNKISYKLDTDGGSSGSPVGWKAQQSVVAVHTNGFSPEDTQKCNSGVSIQAIQKVSTILANSNLGVVFKKSPLPPKKEPEKPQVNNYSSSSSRYPYKRDMY